jgi:hypothetical protein
MKTIHVVHGAIAGVIGASCMTVFRMLAHRAGLLEQMVPQAVERWARGRKRSQTLGDVAAQHAADQLLHLGYGMAWGALYGACFHDSKLGGVKQASGFALFQWAFGMLALFPALKIARPAWRQDALENGLNVTAHLLYGGVTAFLTEEFRRQAETQPRSYLGSRHARIG